jgi:hypothetical protein
LMEGFFVARAPPALQNIITISGTIQKFGNGVQGFCPCAPLQTL